MGMRFFLSFLFWFATFFDTPIYHFLTFSIPAMELASENGDRKQQKKGITQ